jgi:RNA polymerase sigma-70 factor (ECF subfamily)
VGRGTGGRPGPVRARIAGSRSGHWAEPPQRWDELPEERLLARETLARAREAMDELPPRRREVVVLRDVDGWAADEVCDALGLSQGNQRVLLHRARSPVRAALERYLVDEERPRALA